MIEAILVLFGIDVAEIIAQSIGICVILQSRLPLFIKEAASSAHIGWSSIGMQIKWS